MLLINPKTPANAGGALRAASVFGAESMMWTGERVHDALHRYTGSAFGKKKMRLPREERMRAYDIDWGKVSDGERPIDPYVAQGFTPVAVEVRENAESLIDFVHPEDALYVFGPEDGSINKGILGECHRFVQIPSKSCLNLAACVNVVLYDRMAKAALAERGDALRFIAETAEREFAQVPR